MYFIVQYNPRYLLLITTYKSHDPKLFRQRLLQTDSKYFNCGNSDHDMSNFVSLMAVLEGWFDKPLKELPKKQQDRYNRDFFPPIWDSLSPEQRRSVAEQWDYQHDPATEKDRRYWWDFYIRMEELKQMLEEYEKVAAPTTSDLNQKETRIQELKNDIASMEKQRIQAEQKGVLGATVITPPSDYIAYPKALNFLVERLEATPEEVAAWVWQGPKDGGITAYLNIMELYPPPKFYYDYSMGQDYLSPLMGCWFLEDDIANFKPINRYITGKVLIKRWSNFPGLVVEAFIQAKIAESRLCDYHPTYGGTRVSNSDDDFFPPLESGLFVLANVIAIEKTDLEIEKDNSKKGKKIKYKKPEIGTRDWRRQTARKAANARHNKPGGSRDKQKQIREMWATGKYSSRNICAEEECAALGMSYSAARNALKNIPDP